jgi:hypothetical protein
VLCHGYISFLDGLKTCVYCYQTQPGCALVKIRDNGLYIQTHSTFREYCRDRWDLGKPHSHRLIGATKVVDNLSPSGDIQPANESQKEYRNIP